MQAMAREELRNTRNRIMQQKKEILSLQLELEELELEADYLAMAELEAFEGQKQIDGWIFFSEVYKRLSS